MSLYQNRWQGPLVRRDAVARYGPRLLAVLDTVSAHLTTGSLRALGARVELRCHHRPLRGGLPDEPRRVLEVRLDLARQRPVLDRGKPDRHLAAIDHLATCLARGLPARTWPAPPSGKR